MGAVLIISVCLAVNPAFARADSKLNEHPIKKAT
jgi:hypothetical protein